MLNELLIVERGAPQEEVAKAMRHADIYETRQGASTLRIRLDVSGFVVSASPVPDGYRLWTLRTHNDNSFPFIQIKKPLLTDAAVEIWNKWKKNNARPKAPEFRDILLRLAADYEIRQENLGKWATQTVMSALRQRLIQVESLRTTIAEALPAALERFLQACDSTTGGSVANLVKGIRDRLLEGLKATAADAWVRCSVAILLEGDGAIFVEADGDWPCDLADREILASVSEALDNFGQSTDAVMGICALTGGAGQLVNDKFPQADLPTVGPTILFSRYKGRFANDRYARFGAHSMPVGETLARRLAAAARVLTGPERNGTTWRQIPGERPKQTDLLLAFVESAPDAPTAGAFAEDDFAEEASASAGGAADSVAEFEKRTERLIEAIHAKVGADFRQTPVRLAVIRKIDPANRKVVYTGAPTVAAVYDAAIAWSAGERNVPPWLTLPVLLRGESKPQSMSPPHVAPLGMIAFSKQVYIRGGSERQEVVGASASEVLALFLEPPVGEANAAGRRFYRVLRMVLTRRTVLIAGVAHVQHSPDCWKRRKEAIKKFDRREALRTVTVLGILLNKLGRAKEIYMNDAAFKLGQLLAAVDIVHAGYCADVRDGSVPPSLLGNQVFTAAQTAPEKSLAMLCRRWKPYAGWASKAARNRGRADGLTKSKKTEDQQRGWDIKKALRHAREVGPLANELASALAGCTVDDTFRAELLLGYLAGLPKAQKEENTTQSADA